MQGLVWYHTNFLVSVKKKKAHSILIWIALNLDHFGWHKHFNSINSYNLRISSIYF